MIPKAELHVHLEGTITPSLITKIAKRNGLEVPHAIFGPNETLVWQDFLDFLKVFDVASLVIRTPEDYFDITYDYLTRSANEGVIYCEFMPSPDHAINAGLSYRSMLDACIAAMVKAQADTGITSRIIITCVRHYGQEKCEAVAKMTHQYPNDWVVGFGMGGDEVNFPPEDFQRAYEIAHDAGLQCTTHAGEWTGPEKIWTALNVLPIKRLGHGVRACEDANLMRYLHDQQISLEIAPGSNIALGVYDSYAAHPFRQFYDYGIPVSLNSDDPPFFNTTIGREYDHAKTKFKLSDDDLRHITRMALTSSFADQETKTQLLAHIN